MPYQIDLTSLELQDYDGMMLDEFTLIPFEGLFRLVKQEPMPYEKFDSVWVSVTIEVNLDVNHYERKVSTYFDMLSDIGGLTGILGTVFAIVSSIWNFNSFDNHMVSRLFKIKKPRD